MINYVSDLVEFSSDAAFAIDVDSKIVVWNALAKELLGYTASEAVGCYCGDVLQATLLGGEPLCHPCCDIFQCFKVCQPYSVSSCRVRHKKGEWLPVSLASVAISESVRSQFDSNIMAVIFIRDEVKETSKLEPHTLQIFTLGAFGLAVAGHRVVIEKWKRKQAITLLKYLVSQLDRPVHRERLLDSLWPNIDEVQGWGRLKVAISYLRRELRANGLNDEVVKTTDKAYLLRRDAVWVDAFAFERLIVEGQELQHQSLWNKALCCYDEARYLYRGDYLEDETFSDWCAEERERLHEIYLDMLARMVECHAELSQYAEAVHICRKALVFEPCRESFHCLLMDNLAKAGYPEMALVQFRHCQQVLADNFDTEPLPETQRLYQQILKVGRGKKIKNNGRD